jgi:hypothetical protein
MAAQEPTVREVDVEVLAVRPDLLDAATLAAAPKQRMHDDLSKRLPSERAVEKASEFGDGVPLRHSIISTE